jgi:hypothetical protein
LAAVDIVEAHEQIDHGGLARPRGSCQGAGEWCKKCMASLQLCQVKRPEGPDAPGPCATTWFGRLQWSVA